MKWFEILIIIGAIFLVIFPLIRYIYNKKNGKLKCECGNNTCTTACEGCNKCNTKKAIITYTVEIGGMKCGMCESHINDVIRKNFQIINVKSSRKKNILTIKSKTILSMSKIKKVILDEGYNVGQIDFVIS